MTTILAIFAISFALSLALTPLARWIGMRLGAVDVPNERKIHTQPMARTGGVAIFVSFVATLILVSLWKTDVSQKLGLDLKVVGFFVGAGIAFGIRLVDDFHRLRPWVKFLLQVAAASAAFAGGVKISVLGVIGVGFTSAAMQYLLTVFWFVLIINAMNLVDGMDGLATGIALFACIAIVVLSVLRADFYAAMFFAALAGATLGFLRYNFNPASIFLGDGGSYFLGYSIAGLSILAGAKMQMGATLLIPVLALGIPLLDTILAPIRRFVRGKKMFSPDQKHIHHRLREMGLTTQKAVMLLYGVSLVFCVSAVIVVNLRDEQAGLILILMGVGVFLAIRKLGYFDPFHLNKISGWVRDLTDETGLSHERRSFLNVQMEMGSSKDLEGLWKNTIQGVSMLDMDVAEMALEGPDVGGRRAEVGGHGRDGLRDEGTEGRREKTEAGGKGWTEGRRDGETEGGAFGHSVALSLSHERRGSAERGERVEGTCPVCGKSHHTDVGWCSTWVRDGFDLEQDICGEGLFKLELPLLREDGAMLGTLWLVKDLKREPVTHYTLRRIEHLRRTLISTLTKLQSADSADSRRLKNGSRKNP